MAALNIIMAAASTIAVFIVPLVFVGRVCIGYNLPSVHPPSHASLTTRFACPFRHIACVGDINALAAAPMACPWWGNGCGLGITTSDSEVDSTIATKISLSEIFIANSPSQPSFFGWEEPSRDRRLIRPSRCVSAVTLFFFGDGRMLTGELTRHYCA